MNNNLPKIRTERSWTKLCTTLVFLFSLGVCLQGAAAKAVGPTLRPALFLKDGVVLPKDEPITLWGTCDDHATVEVKFDDEILITEADSSGWWMVSFPARPATAGPLTLTITAGSEKAVVKEISIGEVSSETDLKPASPFQSHAVLQRDKPIPVWGTGAPNAEVEARLGDETVKTKTSATGQWKVTFAARPASEIPVTLTIDSQGKKVVLEDILIGDVWVAGGQSNMEWVFGRLPDAETIGDGAKIPTLRYFTGPDLEASSPQSQRPAEWLVCSPETVGDFSGVAFYFARALQEELKVPIGLMDANWGGTKIEPWTPPHAFATQAELKEIDQSLSQWHPSFPGGKAAQMAWLEAMQKWSEDAIAAIEAGRTPSAPPAEPGNESEYIRKQNPTRIYNAMVAPIVPYAIRGFIWYQGENNAGDALYLPKMRALIAGWRKAWGQELPFYYVQLAAFNNGKPGESPPFADQPWAVVRDAQLKALSIPRTGMAVAIDVGEETKVHPRNKKDVGSRLAQWALHDEYGRKDVVPSGPLFERAEIDGTKVRVHFRHADGGLKTGTKTGTDTFVPDEGKITWIALKGGDGKWVPGDAAIEGETLVVSYPADFTPVEIAYAYAGYPNGANIYNAAGLPASPFRADLTSSPVKK